MNYCGSYRRLLGNSRSAMLCAIEIYNKPQVDYRDECFVILLMNAWELILKAMISKNGQSIYYPKERNKGYRTLSCHDAFNRALSLFPSSVPVLPVQKNLELLTYYRDNAVHFYNKKGFGILVYDLAQTSITNYGDVLLSSFGSDLAADITWQLVPVGVRPPVDPAKYISGLIGSPKHDAVTGFVSQIARAHQEVEDAGSDTSRLSLSIRIALQSVKKIANADATVAVIAPGSPSDALAVMRPVDPNVSHPYRQTEVLDKITERHGKPFGSRQFQAIAWKLGIKGNPSLFWQSSTSGEKRYSAEVLAHIRRLTAGEVADSVRDYAAHMKERRRKKSADS